MFYKSKIVFVSPTVASEISLEEEGVEADIVTQTGSRESQQEAGAVKNHLKTTTRLSGRLFKRYNPPHVSRLFWLLQSDFGVPPHQ